jgi:hypothetical protein
MEKKARYLEDIHNLYFSSNFYMFDFLFELIFELFSIVHAFMIIVHAYVFQSDLTRLVVCFPRLKSSRNRKTRQMPKIQWVQLIVSRKILCPHFLLIYILT